MLSLDTEQTAALQRLSLQRGCARLAEALGAAFPEVATRAGERLAALVAHGVQRGQAHGLVAAVCLGRYLGCWFVWGAEFEGRPGFEWAQAILGDARRHQGAKAHQLCRRTEEELQRRGPGPGVPPPAQWRAALETLDAALAEAGAPGWLVPGPRVVMGQPCDLDAVDLRLASQPPRQAWTLQPLPGAAAGSAQWLRAPVTVQPDFVMLDTGNADLGASAPGLPPEISVLAPTLGEPQVARLRVRTLARQACDPATHPCVSLTTTTDIQTWRGPFAQDLSLPLQAAPDADPLPGRLQPALAVESTPTRWLLEVAGCGIRDSGAPLGELQTRLALYPATQWLLAWHREPTPPGQWTAAGAAPAGPSTAARVRLERDGQPRPAADWLAGLQQLDEALARAPGQLLAGWERAAAVAQGQLAGQLSLMAGSASLSFGWSEGPGGLVGPAVLRALGQQALQAVQADLCFTGLLELEGSRSRLSLRCQGHRMLQGAWQRDAREPDWSVALDGARLAWRLPFELQIEALAQEDAELLNAAGPPAGALVGECGLRRRADGPGLQWFARVQLEAVSAPLTLDSPWLGRRHLQQALLPAMKLIDWSLG